MPYLEQRAAAVSISLIKSSATLALNDAGNKRLMVLIFLSYHAVRILGGILVISLNKEDIDWENKEAVVTNGKTKDREKIYFTDRSLLWLKKYLDSRKDDLLALFVSGRGRMLSVTARNYLRTHTQHLGIRKHIKHHIIRKTFATHLIQGGADITAVGDLCRHRSPRTTLRYYAVVNKERSKDLHRDILGRMIRGSNK